MPNELGHILLLESDATLASITAFRLELLGYRAVVVGSAESANQALLAELPGLVAVGQIAEGDAIDWLNRLSNDPRTNALPVIYLSASFDPEEVQRAYNAGADEYLVTPYDPLVLEKKVEALLSAAGQQAGG